MQQEKQGKKKVPVWAWVVGVILVLAVIGSRSSGPDTKSKENTSKPEPAQVESVENEKASPAAAKESEPEKEWVIVAELSGKGNKRSDVFELTGAKCKLKYNADGGDMAAFAIYVMKEGTAIMEDGGFPEIMADGGGSDDTFLTKSPGNYYIDVTAANLNGWTVTIEEFR